MRLRVVLGADKQRSKIQVPGLEPAEIPFHKGQVLIAVMDGLRAGLAGLAVGL